jgi:hypothetical protein
VLARRAALLERARELDACQQGLAFDLAEVREELAVTRAVMWPDVDRHLVRGWRHTFATGPAPLPPPAPNAIALRGAQLRYAAIAVLVDTGEPLTLTEIHRALHLRGYVLSGRHPVQQLADALAYEHEQGRANRVGRGVYEAGVLSPADRRRARDPRSVPNRVRSIHEELIDNAAGEHRIAVAVDVEAAARAPNGA